MTAILSDDFRVKSATDLMDSFVSKPSYIFIGKDSEWENIEEGEDPRNTVSYLKSSIKSIIQGKLIQAGNMSLVCNKFEWKQNEVYDMYDDIDSSLFSSQKQFYVITPTNDVYKCLNNNGGRPSTIMPTGKSLTPINLADKYVWKYMLRIPQTELDAFGTSQYFPVSNDPVNTTDQYLVKSAAIAGAIQSYKITNGGGNYSAAALVITGDGIGAKGLVEISNGVITNILVSNPGSGYTFANVTVVGDGIAASVRPILAPNNGHGYDAAYELGAHYLMIKMEFGAILDNLRTVNDFSYKQVGIISNIKDSTSLVEFNNGILIGTHRVRVNSFGNIDVGDTLTFESDSSSCIVIGKYTNAGNYFILSDCRLPVVSEFIKLGNESPVQILAVTKSDILKHSGNICYIENRKGAIIKNPTQTETVRIIIEL